jgi:APA family basic amino acid/polyamine antiporter
MPGFPVVPVIYMLAAVMILILGFLRSPGPSSIAILTVVVGVPAYFLFKKRYEKDEKPCA